MADALSVVLASNNRGKLAELTQLLAPWAITVLPQSQFAANGAEETGSTFAENALLKARYAARAANLPAIADDSGLAVDALLGAPGVYSARYAGESATDADNNRKLLAALADTPVQLRTARFHCVLAYVRDADDPQPLIVAGIWEGSILLQPQGDAGFGYDPLFLPLGNDVSAAQLSRDQKNAVSHRGQALRALLNELLARGELIARGN